MVRTDVLKGGVCVYPYRGKHTSSMPWAVSSSASRHYRSRHAQQNRRRRFWRRLLLLLLLVLLLIPFIDPLFLRTDRMALVSEDLPSDIGHLHLVYVSDIHYGFFYSQGRVRSLVNRINSLKPDLVLFGGGYSTDNAGAIQFFKNLPSIHSRYEILGVIGDTDRGDTDMDLTLLLDAMRGAGVTPLVNGVRQVRLGNSSVYVAGADDALTGAPDLKSLAASVSADDYVIFLSHNPSVIPEARNLEDRSGKLGWFDLALFGHTHGGQIAFFSPLLDIGRDVDDRYRGGWLQENRVDMLISNGVGTSVIPARLFCPAQIHYIDVSVQ